MSDEHSCIDFGRYERQGFPEVVYCAGKTTPQVVDNLRLLAEAHGHALGTRLDPERAGEVLAALEGARYDELSRTVTLGERPVPGDDAPLVSVVCAGTSDLPVSCEAEVTLRFLGHRVGAVRDVGVAGLHRLDARLDELRGSAVVIVVAGMEGALPSVIGGLVAAPVIAVPTSVGYGASFQGLAALLGMLNSCASGLTVTNIDNGFGAAMAAHRILSSK
jgi:NCAIR mutase (PurE)-related protein